MRWVQITQDCYCIQKCVGCHVVEYSSEFMRVYELRKEIVIFLNKQNHLALAELFGQEKFIANVAYLADIFDSLNCLNQTMQGPGFTVIDHTAKKSNESFSESSVFEARVCNRDILQRRENDAVAGQTRGS